MKLHVQYGLSATVALLILLTAGTISSAAVTKDTSEDATEPATDLLSVETETNSSEIVITLQTAKPYDFPNTQLLFDTDKDATTGFANGHDGFDLLIEGANIFRFHGDDQTTWSWKASGNARRTVDQNTLKLTISRKLLSKDFLFFARTLTGSYTELDRLPDSGTIAVSPEDSDKTTKPLTGSQTERTGDADDSTRDITSISARQVGPNIRVELQVEQAGDFATLLVFFDTDHKASTGYRSASADGLGFDALLSGGRIHRFNGSKQNDWVWEGLSDASVSVKSTRYQADFDAGDLNSKHAKVVAMMMSPDWQTVVDSAPDAGPIDLEIDTSKIVEKPKATVAAPRENRNLSPRKRVALADSFYCYYGSGKVAELSHYDVVIAHSPQMKPNDIATLTNLGVVMVGYLTVGEDDKLRTANGSGPGGYASWYLDEDNDNKPDQNGIWKSYYADANDPNWRIDRVNEARRLINEEGYDGIFLDTIDTSSAYPKTKPGMIKLVEELRAALPDAPIILNQGFPLLADLAPMADGLMLESFTATYDFRTHKYVLHTPSSIDWTRGVAQRIIGPVLEKNPLKVLVLDYALPQDTENIQVAADRAATFGYLFAIGPITLDAVYNTGIRGESNPKWLKRQATPESLRYTLKEATNGFPANTILTPSSCFSGYKVNPVVDGIKNRQDLYWADSAWASAEDGDDAWLELRFPQPISSGQLRIQWAIDNGRLHASREYTLDVLRGDKWKRVASVKDNTSPVGEHSLPDKPFDAIRISQPAGGGSASRPNLMWISQVERKTDS